MCQAPMSLISTMANDNKFLSYVVVLCTLRLEDNIVVKL